MGKTTFIVKLILNSFRFLVERIIIVCPTFFIQDVFKPLHKLVLPKDVYESVTKNDFDLIYKNIAREQKARKLKGEPLQKILILVDDMAGTTALHGGQISPFAHLAIQTPHWSTSMIVLTQGPTLVSPSFRKNAENILVFPSEGQIDVDWLKNTFQSVVMEPDKIRQILIKAWRGGRHDDKEWGLHFLFIESPPRRHTRFWIDFDKEIRISKRDRDDDPQLPLPLAKRQRHGG